MMITTSKQISTHFHSYEFVCQHCGNIKIDENLVNKMEHIFDKLQASKCIISSGYRCWNYDIYVGGFAGRHSEGLASDCVFYDKNGNMIPSKIVCCVAYDLGELNGIAKIDEYYVHLDNRQNGYYHGDETKGINNCWTNPYTYFNVSSLDVSKYTGENKISTDELAREVLKGKYGNGEERKKKLGSRYQEVQNRVNELLKQNEKCINDIAREVINGNWGNGQQRKEKLEKAGFNYQLVQNRVNEILRG